jgi:hypothetical protein
MPTIFYAWQSDRDLDICRYLIRDAAKLAMKKLKTEPHVLSAPAFKLDQDRQGVTGHPHIASVIRKKIKACDVFLADLTHVVGYKSADGRRKKAQNPNVLIELGIAVRAKGFERLILVMNDKFGSPDDLPFDLKSHSFPITYTLADATNRAHVKVVREALADQIAAALKPMLAQIAAQMSHGEETSGRDRAEEKSTDFYARLNAGDFHGLKSAHVPVIVLGDPPPPRDAFCCCPSSR